MNDNDISKQSLDELTHPDISVDTEMLKYDIFYRTSVSRRMGDLSNPLKLSDQKELPSGAILHILDNIETMDETSPVTPSEQNPLLKLLPDKKLIYNQSSFTVDNPLVEPDLTGITKLAMGVSQELKAYRAAHSGNVRYVSTPTELPDRSTIQSIINYNPLFRLRVTGRFKRLRVYRAIMSTVINVISKMTDRDHIIHIPMSDLVFTKPDFIKAFKEQNKMSVRYPEVPHYLAMMDLLCYIEADSTEGVFGTVPEDIMSRITLALTNSDKVIYYRLDTLKEMNGVGNSILIKVIKHMNTLSDSAVVLDEPTDEVTVNQEIVEVKVSIDKPSNVTGVKSSFSEEAVSKATEEYFVDLEQTSNMKIDANPSLTPAQKERAKTISKKWKEIDIEGVPLQDIITKSNDQSIEDNTLDFMKGEIPDESMAKSSVANFNGSYMKKMFTKDLVSNLVAFGGQGMFLTNISTTDTSDEFNEQIEYAVKFEDAKGKTHNIKFTLPKVNEMGHCLINGNYKSMRLQRVNTPICKISPTRVSLNSYSSKQLVERNVAKAHSFYESFKRAISKAQDDQYGFTGDSIVYPSKTLPYDYTELASNHSSFVTSSFRWTFNYDKRYVELNPEVAQTVAAKESKFGIFFGLGGVTNEIAYFINMQCVVSKYDVNTKKLLGKTTILDETVDALNVKVPNFTEWVTLSVLNKTIPTIFALCYRFGFMHMLDYVGADYEIYEVNERVTVATTDIVIKFNDKKLVIKGTPKLVGLLFGGFSKFDLSNTSIEEMESRDAYFDMMQDLKLSINYLRGIDAMFDGFIDPITRDILVQMGEPTNMKDLLIRATVLLTTTDHLEPASAGNHRFRSYERMTGVVYSKLQKALNAYNNSSSANKTFSVSPYEISQAIVTDPLLRNVETLNPITAAKEMCGATHIGEGGRSSETFVVKDRQYTKDNIGILSESTVDSGKVAVDVQTSVNPTMVSARGLTESKDVKDLEPSNILSTTSLLIPFADRDDGKRAMFINIQMGQYVATNNSSVSRVRTGYEKVIAHHSRMPFAYPAERNGQVVDIDEDLSLMKIRYSDGSIYVLAYGEQYTKASGFYATQKLVINNLKAGSKFKKGDILIYNSGYFASDPFGTQVNLKHGRMANVAIMELADTMEDSDRLTKRLADDLVIQPVHVRDIIIDKNTTVHEIVKVGTELKSTDALIVFDDSTLPAEYSENQDLLDSLIKLNRSIPKAKYDSTVVKIEVLHKIPTNELSDSLQKIVKYSSKDKNGRSKYAESSGAENESSFHRDDIYSSDKYNGKDLEAGAVVVKFYLQQNLPMNAGDKIVFAGSLKSVTAKVVPETMLTEDGEVEVDACMSTISMLNRIILDCPLMGSLNRILETMENEIINIYDS